MTEQTKLLEVKVETGTSLSAQELWNGSLFVYLANPSEVLFKLNDSKAIPLIQSAGGTVEMRDIVHRNFVYRVIEIIAKLEPVR